jgi:hypothetical protein
MKRSRRRALPMGGSRKANDDAVMCEPCPPGLPDPPLPVERAGELPVDRPRRVGVVAEIDRAQHPVVERFAPIERPQSRLERLDHVPGASDRWRLLAAEGAGFDGRNTWSQGLPVPQTRHRRVWLREKLFLRHSFKGSEDQDCEIAAGVDGLDSLVSRPRVLGCPRKRRTPELPVAPSRSRAPIADYETRFRRCVLWRACASTR